MRHTKADIERAKRHVVDAEKRVAKQRVLVDELERDGHRTAGARELMQVMVDLLDQIRTHADEIANDVRRD
jgi:hypothetical protein